MRKIGLSLVSGPGHGGSFHYARSLLEAVLSLPAGEFSSVVFYSDESWAGRLAQYDCDSRHIGRRSLFMRSLGRLYLGTGLPLEGWRQSLGRIGTVNKSFIRANCDLWIFATHEPDTYMMPLPALSVVFDLMHRYEPRFPEASNRREYRRRERHFNSVAKYSVGSLVDSDIGKQQFCESYGAEKSSVHVLPFVPTPALQAGIEPSEVKETYGLPDKFLFYPAQFWQHKNHEVLIRASALILEQCSDLHWVFAGSRKNNRENVERLIAELGLQGHVTILGFVPDEHLKGLYQLARAMVMPTYFGPTNIPPLEAMATGCPVAVSGIYGMPQQVGDAGLTFDPDSPEEVADVLGRLWLDDRLCAEMTDKGLLRSAAWSQDQFNETFRRIVEKVLN